MVPEENNTGPEKSDQNRAAEPDKESDTESIQLDGSRNAFFSGTSIVFPANPQKQDPAPRRTETKREPVPEPSSSKEKDRSFLSFFDVPDLENGSPSDTFSSFFQEEEQREDGLEGEAYDLSGEEDDDGEETPLSFDEYVQNESEETTKEDLDNLIRQNDADTLFAFGEQYERPAEQQAVDEETDGEISINPTSILEAMLFVGNRENRPLPIDKAVSLMRNVTEEDAMNSVSILNQRYAETGAPYQIQITEAGLFLELRPELEMVRERFFNKTKEVKLSQKAIDILALVAYRQPITSAEIQTIRPQSGGILNVLLKRGLIEQEIIPSEKGEIPQYKTTSRLLKILGISSIKELPIVDELDYR